MQEALGSINLLSIWPLLVVIVIVGVAYAIVVVLKANPHEKDAPDESGGADVLPYAPRQGVLTAGELAFFPVLLSAVRLVAEQRQAAEPLVLAKVRLADVVEVATAESGSLSLTPSQRTTAQNRINSKHVDFVVCHPQTTRPLVVVELDDSSHNQPRRQARDEFVDRVCGSGPRPIHVLHVRASSSYDAERLAKQIQEALVPIAAAGSSSSKAQR